MGRDATNKDKQSITAYLNDEDFKFINKLKDEGVPEQQFGFSNYGDVVSYLLNFYGKEPESETVQPSRVTKGK